MKSLKALNFAVLNKAPQEPALVRRAALIQRLEHQRALALDPNYIRIVKRWVANEQGSKSLVEVQKRVRPWWKEDVQGTVVLTVRSGARTIEFEKGKSAILVPGKDQLVPTIDTVIAAVRAGELDDHLSQPTNRRAAPKPKKAA
jgi:hypothetical protein